MSEYTIEDFTKRNEQNQEKLEKLKKYKQRMEKVLKRPHPLNQFSSHQNHKNSKPLVLDIDHHRTPTSAVDSLMEPSKDNIDQNGQHDQSNRQKNHKGFQFNSTLFQNLGNSSVNSQNFNSNRIDDFMHNYSDQSAISRHQSNNDHSMSNNIMDKVQEALANARQAKKKDKNHPLDDYSRNSSQLSQESVISLRENDSKLMYQLPSSRSNKLKTIEQEKQTLTIDRDGYDSQKETKQRHNLQKKHNQHKNDRNKQILQVPLERKKNNYPPLSSNINSALERQKQKLQQTMNVLKKKDPCEESEKESIVFDLSDNSDQQCEHAQRESIEEKNKEIERENEGKREGELRKQREELRRELKIIDAKIWGLCYFSDNESYSE